jgi:glycosyltransferase involved in cell wall biosynthesis
MRISVVIPAYNASAFLPRCLKSVFAQTRQPDEVIVVDDGSRDNSAALAAELGARVISLPNGGPASARNAGIQSASSEWIALLDADDLWAPEKLERQALAVDAGTVLVYTGIRIFDDNGVRAEAPAVDAASAKKMLRYSNPIIPSTTLVKREAILQLGGFRDGISGCEDWEMWFRLRQLGQFKAIHGPLTDYYVHPKSLSSNPGRMLQALDGFIDTTLLADLRGLDRWAWRRRIRAVQLCSAGLIARENGLKDEVRYMFRSLSTWPSPFWQPRRFAVFAVSARNSIGK